MTKLPHFVSYAAVGFAAMTSPSDLPCFFKAATLSRMPTSMSRYSMSCARPDTGPWPGTTIVLSVARAMFASAARIDERIEPVPVRVARRQDVGLGEVNVQIAIRVSWRIGADQDLLITEVQRQVSPDNQRWKRALR